MGLLDCMPRNVCVRAPLFNLNLCNPKDYSPPGSAIHGIFQARILEWVPHPGDQTRISVSPALAGGFFTATPPGIGQKPRAIVKGLQTGVEIGSNLPPSLP